MVASEKGASSIEDVAKRYRFSKEFVVESILYYVTSCGSIIDDDSYLIDFNLITIVSIKFQMQKLLSRIPIKKELRLKKRQRKKVSSKNKDTIQLI